MSENVTNHGACIKTTLTDTMVAVGIGAHSYNLAAQRLETVQIIRCWQKSTATCQSAGVYFKTLPLLDQNAENLIQNIPMIGIRHGTVVGGIAYFTEDSKVSENIKIIMDADAIQGFL